MAVALAVATHNFTQQYHILAAYDENAAWNVTILVAHMNSFDSFVQYQIGELIDTSQVTN